MSEFPQIRNVMALNKAALIALDPERSQKISWTDRGLGYWSWKPLSGLNLLEGEGRDSEFLLYLDGGCWINATPGSSQTFDAYLEMAREWGGLVFSSGAGNSERKYCKDLTWETLGNSKIDKDSDQLWAGGWILHKSQVRDFLSRWWDLCVVTDLINDDISMFEDPAFVEHRHDQSIFSLLAKQSGFFVSPHNVDVNPAIKQPTLQELNLPFWASRHRSGMQSLSMSPIRRGLRLIERLLP